MRNGNNLNRTNRLEKEILRLEGMTMTMMMMLRKGLGTLNSVRGSTPLPRIYPRFSASPSPVPKTDVLAAGAAADVSGDDLLVEDAVPLATRATTEEIPELLQPRVVIYDGVCHLCHKGVKWVLQADRDKKIKFCCLQSKTAEPYLRICGVDRKDVLRRFLFIEGLGLYHQGSTAALRVLSYLPLPYSALSTLTVVPTPLRDAAYDYVARKRYNWFGKDQTCLVLRDKELLHRFIDRDELLDQSRSDVSKAS